MVMGKNEKGESRDVDVAAPRKAAQGKRRGAAGLEARPSAAVPRRRRAHYACARTNSEQEAAVRLIQADTSSGGGTLRYARVGVPKGSGFRK